MQIRVTFIVVAVALLLAGCAPTALGSRANPFDVRSGAATVTRDSRTFILAAFDPGVFGYRVQDLPGRWVPWGAGAAATVTTLFSISELVAPEGWNVEVDQVRAFDVATRAGVTIEATLALDVPAGARLGGQRLRVELAARNGQRQTFEFVAQVVP